jgi:DNA-binding transcriptional LysR family regulator
MTDMRFAYSVAGVKTRSVVDRGRLLPLLPHLAAVLAERHVSRAASRVGVTQPTMSRTLAAAREIMDDPLLIRTSSGAALTPRGEELRRFIAATFREFDAFWATPAFAPESAAGTVRIAATDYAAQLFLPALVARIRGAAPGIDVEVVPWSVDARRLIEEGAVHLGLNPLGAAPRGFYRRRVADDRYAVVLAAGHPLARGPLGVARFADASHVLTVTEGGELGVVDRALRRRRVHRRVVVRVRDFATAAAMVAASDLLATIPHRLALSVRDRFDLVVRDPPIELPPIRVDLVWHERRHRDPLLAWVRRLLAPADDRGATPR